MKFISSLIFFIVMVSGLYSQPGDNPQPNQYILLTFTEPMDSVGFGNTDNFLVYDSNGDTLKVYGGGVESDQPTNGFTKFVIITDPMRYDLIYTVKVSNVRDVAGNYIEGANFVFTILPFRKTSIPKPDVWMGSPNSPGFYVLIEAGGTIDYIDTDGRVWKSDYGYSNGIAINRGAIQITNSYDDQIYRTERYSVNNYAIPVSNGTYIVKLHFAETYVGITSIGQRVFSVNVEGQQINNLDVYAEAGGRNIALVKTFNNIVVSDGEVNISFTRVVQNQIINGIEIYNK